MSGKKISRLLQGDAIFAKEIKTACTSILRQLFQFFMFVIVALCYVTLHFLKADDFQNQLILQSEISLEMSKLNGYITIALF